jgi:hydrogenase maturation protease
MPIPECEILTTSGEGISLINMWEGYSRVILVDAVTSDSEAGMIHHLDANRDAVDSTWFSSSTHLFSVPEAVLLAKQLKRFPESLTIYGIEGENFDYGIELSAKVNEAIDRLTPLLIQAIAHGSST